ncbi:MAG: alpha/beta fold hydrolase, partial [Planctomycetota bacterium]|nr:alpha/beta fold hydrolase [Planctomycetota bacterium]
MIVAQNHGSPLRVGLVWCCTGLLGCLASALHAQKPLGTIKHGYIQSGEVRIHYVTQGQGPLVVMVHGFPDYWYSWRKQIPVLAQQFQVVAIDQRGYNRSGHPQGVRQYTMEKLVGDLKAVVDHFPQNKAVIVGHDWGG